MRGLARDLGTSSIRPLPCVRFLEAYSSPPPHFPTCSKRLSLFFPSSRSEAVLAPRLRQPRLPHQAGRVLRPPQDQPARKAPVIRRRRVVPVVTPAPQRPVRTIV